MHKMSDRDLRIATLTGAIVGTGLRVSPAAYREVGFTLLLTPDGYNPKTKKGRARGYSTAIMHFAPANLSGYEVCRHRSAGCTAACLNTAGHGGIIKAGETTNEVQLARIARTRLFFLNRFLFNLILVREIETHVRVARAHGMIPCVRLNGTSDLDWERLRLNDGRTVLETFPDVQFYDYTKVTKRAIDNGLGKHPANYRLCMSRSETNWSDCVDVLNAGGTVAVVFQRSVPESYEGYTVVNGDADDLRHLDPAGVIIGLKAKGKGKKDTTGFVLAQPKPARVRRPKAIKTRASRPRATLAAAA